MSNLENVTYCGLYCGLCSARGRIPHQAHALQKSMEEEGYPVWGKEIPDFEAFWSFLGRMCDPQKVCSGCRQGGGPPFCSIRICCSKNGLDVCVSCKEYPCHRIRGLAKGYPTLLADGLRIKEIGIEKWIEEQETRAKKGVVYADILCHPYEVPRD
ncbi:MAG: DUF3795 domain-containing protein [Theionarchaea archaeon]|nr:DUF3795 domain-containing protein [Theionarchaea archaeon]MBU7038674.1 DUF3795 domain-containing protein [Theionarchaea archaeon]